MTKEEDKKGGNDSLDHSWKNLLSGGPLQVLIFDTGTNKIYEMSIENEP